MSDVQRQGKSVLILAWQINRRVSKREKGSSFDWGETWEWLELLQFFGSQWQRAGHKKDLLRLAATFPQFLLRGSPKWPRMFPSRTTLTSGRTTWSSRLCQYFKRTSRQTLFWRCCSQDQDDCSKRLLCELNARAAAGRSLSPNEELIAQVSSQPYMIYHISYMIQGLMIQDIKSGLWKEQQPGHQQGDSRVWHCSCPGKEGLTFVVIFFLFISLLFLFEFPLGMYLFVSTRVA